MAFDLGSVIAHVKADITDFQNGINKAKGITDGFKSNLNKLDDALSGIRTTATIVGGIAIGGLSVFLKDASQEAANFEKAMVTLDIISGRFGVSADKAKISAKQLGSELRIGTGAAAESLQNLLKSGLSLEQSSELLKRFTNEAITGKSPTISLSQAVQNLSFAYATNNSALGNLSGINENFMDITERGRKALEKEGKSAKDITEEMAKFRGMMDLTNLTLGSSERFVGSYIDKQAILGQKILELKINLGQKLNPILAQLTGIFSDFVTNYGDKIVVIFQEFIDVVVQLATWIGENKDLVLGFLGGLAIAFTALTIVSYVSAALVALTNPITWVIIAITALFTAWQTNFLGIRDITGTAINGIKWLFENVLMPVFQFFYTWFSEVLAPAIVAVWQGFIMPLFQAFVDWFKERWDHIKNILEGAWNIISGLFQYNFIVITGIFSALVQFLTGHWDTAWETVKYTFRGAWEALKKIFGGIIEFIGGWGGLLVHELVKPFEDAWNRIRDFVDKIKNALDFTKRHSPSVVDIVRHGVGEVNRAMEGLQFSTTLAPKVAGLAVSNGGQSTMINDVNIDLSGAMIADEYSAGRIAENIGDAIIKKLQLNVRF